MLLAFSEILMKVRSQACKKCLLAGFLPKSACEVGSFGERSEPLASKVREADGTLVGWARAKRVRFARRRRKILGFFPRVKPLDAIWH